MMMLAKHLFMDCKLSLVFGIVWLLFHITNTYGEIRKEYCSSEALNISCRDDHVILVINAQYGRMRAGRCISDKYAHVMGCSSDVTAALEEKCSGRNHCHLDVALLDKDTQPCPKDFKSYLDITTRCVAVHKPNKCLNKNETFLTDTSGYLSPFTSSIFDQICPWRISAHSGRRISFSLLNFALSNGISFGSNQRDNGCPINVVFTEGTKTTKLELCSSTQQNHVIYSSRSHVVTVRLLRPSGVVDMPILLQFSIHGCRDIPPQEGAMVKRMGDTAAAVICNSTMETWYMTCKEDEWVGQPGNCSTDNIVSRKSGVFNRTSTFKYGILVAVFVGVVLGVFVGGLLLCVVLLIRKNRRRQQQKPPSQDDLQYETRIRPQEGSYSYPVLLKHQTNADSDTSEYTHVWSKHLSSVCSEGPYCVERSRNNVISVEPENGQSCLVETLRLNQRSFKIVPKLAFMDTPVYADENCTLENQGQIS